MKNCKELFRELIREITVHEPMEEIESLAYVLLQDCFGITRIQVLSEELIIWSPLEDEKLLTAIRRLNSCEPVQYITGVAPFFGRSFRVEPGVLIPRPETEELVLEVLRFASGMSGHRPFRILDIGTGSGCIPVTLSLELPDVSIIATDISDRALGIARQNVVAYKVPVQLIQHDILRYPIPIGDLDVVVSNPPYITDAERPFMNRNVVEHEPPLALFVPDEDPLLFYRTISWKARQVLNPGGLLAFEINERFGREVVMLLQESDYEKVELLHDISGKPRIVKALMPR